MTDAAWWTQELSRKEAMVFALYVGVGCGAFVGALSPRPLEGSLVGAVLMGIGSAVYTVAPVYAIKTRRGILLAYAAVTVILAFYWGRYAS